MSKTIKSYPSTFIYISVIFFSIMIIMSSNNWFFTWMGMELSLFGFLPIFAFNQSTTEGLMKYFLMQASGSAMFIFSCLSTIHNIWILTILGMTMKLGIFPFFQWMPMVMTSLSWSGCLLLTTLQKLGPMLILVNINEPNVLFTCAVTGILVSSVLGFNQIMMKPLMAYSSITFTSWIIMALWFDPLFGSLFIFFYFVLTIQLFSLFKKTNTLTTYNTPNNPSLNMPQNQAFLILAGVPPFSLFFFKMYMFFLLAKVPLLMIILVISTYISMYYYLMVALPKIALRNKFISTNNMFNDFPGKTVNGIHYLPMFFLTIQHIIW